MLPDCFSNSTQMYRMFAPTQTGVLNFAKLPRIEARTRRRPTDFDLANQMPAHRPSVTGELPLNKIRSVLHQPAAGLFILRWAVAGSLLIHGISKLSNGIAGIQGLVTNTGLPAFVAYGVLIGEVLAPLLVLANRLVVPAALVMAFNMAVAVGLVHAAQVFTLGKSGGWALELQGLYFFGSLAIALLAPRKS